MIAPYSVEEQREIQDALLLADEDVIDEIIREAEIFIGEQLKAALSADSRALTLAGILGAGITLLTGNLITVSGSQPHIWPYAFGIVVTIVAFIIALFCVVSAAKPIRFEYSGNSPDEWLDDIRNKTSLEEARAGQAFAYAVGIRLNKVALETNQRLIILALTIAPVGLVIGFALAVFFAIVRFSSGTFP